MCNASRSFLVVAIGFGAFAGCGGSDALGLDPVATEPSTSTVAGQTSTQPPAVTSPPTQTSAPTPQGPQPVTECGQVVVLDPAVSLDGIALYAPAQKQGNPAAGIASYVYLAAGKEGVILTGPSVASADGLLSASNPSITMVGVRSTSADGYDVVVNRNLQFHVAIVDFEFEVALARVELCEQNGDLQSRFVFKGNALASGVAHDITITPSTTSKVTSLPPPVTVEVR